MSYCMDLGLDRPLIAFLWPITIVTEFRIPMADHYSHRVCIIFHITRARAT